MNSIQKTPMYETILFSEIYESSDDFLEDYANIGIPTTISTESATTLFFLLYARYANNPIANFDITQWKYKLFSIVFQYGPTWEKRLDLQNKLRNLTDDELVMAFKGIYNHAYNPSTAPSTSTLTELQYINDQNTNTSTRGKLDAYGKLWDLLEADVSEEFLKKFVNIFKKFVAPEKPLLYYEEDDDGSDS